jgi:Tfp pilus assembly protein PilO
MMQIVHRARRLLRGHAAATLAGAALLVAAGAYYVVLVLPARAELADLRAAVDAGQARMRKVQGSGAAPKLSVDEQLRTFHAFFPRPEAAPRWLDTLYMAGRAYGLSMPSGEYKLERSNDAALARYHVMLPVAGSYTQIRQFIAHVLKEVPAASLDDVQLRSDPDAKGHVEARLRFSLYFGGM